MDREYSPSLHELLGDGDHIDGERFPSLKELLWLGWDINISSKHLD
jgi:hypothetical protein